MLLCTGRYGAFQRAFPLPTIVDQAKIHATYSDGVLIRAEPVTWRYVEGSGVMAVYGRISENSLANHK